MGLAHGDLNPADATTLVALDHQGVPARVEHHHRHRREAVLGHRGQRGVDNTVGHRQ